jgi:hypothetical protein
MKGQEMNHKRHLIQILILFFVPTLSAVAQQPQEFVLPTAHVGEDYRAEIESVLRDKYQLRLESGKLNAVILWTTAVGDVPAGLSVRTDGTVIGRPTDVRAGIYQFSLKAVDMAMRDEPLELRFSLEVKAGRLRLTKIEGPRLVPVDNAVFNHPSTVSPEIEPKESSTKKDDRSPNGEPAK